MRHFSKKFQPACNFCCEVRPIPLPCPVARPVVLFTFPFMPVIKIVVVPVSANRVKALYYPMAVLRSNFMYRLLDCLYLFVDRRKPDCLIFCRMPRIAAAGLSLIHIFLGDEAAGSEEAKKFELPARLIAPAFASVHLDVLDSAHTEYVLGGGRGSAKSSYVSLEIINLLKENPDMNALILRKVGNTLRGSVYAQILWAIEALDLSDEFEATVSPMEITHRKTGQKILFRGADDPLKVKSVKPVHGYIGIVWFEELDQFAGDEECRSIQQSAIRGGDRAYIFKTFNPPKTKCNWANQYIQTPKDTRLVHHSDYRSVPKKWLGKTFLEEADYLRQINPSAYEHEYLGIPNGNGGRCV